MQFILTSGKKSLVNTWKKITLKFLGPIVWGGGGDGLANNKLIISSSVLELFDVTGDMRPDILCDV